MPCGQPGVKVKVCGVTDAASVAACAAAGVDFVGFNFWSGSPRVVSVEDAQALATGLPEAIVPVAVCVWTDSASVDAALATGFPWIQVHETPAGWRWREQEGHRTLVRALRADHPLKASDLKGAHYYLVDTPSKQVGGSGRTFDWSLVEALRGDDRLFLAGGLRPENVGEAIAQVRPYAVDVASGVESAPGKKDPQRVEALVQRVLEWSE
jgi:phosphoribosylanthranilate isomerase